MGQRRELVEQYILIDAWPNHCGSRRPSASAADADVSENRFTRDMVFNKEIEMAQSLPEIEKDALRLSAEDRARLAVRLLSSLEEATESPEKIEKLWIAEAERRFQELHDSVVQGIPAREVFAELRNKKA